MPRFLSHHHTRIIIAAALLLAVIMHPGSLQEVFAADGGGEITAPARWLFMYPTDGDARLNVITGAPAAVGEGLKLAAVGDPASGRIMAWNNSGAIMYEPNDRARSADHCTWQGHV